MVFEQPMGAFGVDGPSIETVFAISRCRPGEELAGEVRMRGGDHDMHVHQVTLSLLPLVEHERDDHEGTRSMEFHRGAITGGFDLDAGRYHSIPFQLPIPWELPITEVYGQRPSGMTMGVRTELEIDGAVDEGDLDPISVAPLPSQQRVLDAFAELGFAFKNADVEAGRIAGIHQELPVHQEIEFYAPFRYSGHISEVGLTFVASPYGLAVVLKADRRGELFAAGGESFGRFQVDHRQALHMAWEHEIDTWLQAVAERLHDGGPGVGAGAAVGAAGEV